MAYRKGGLSQTIHEFSDCSPMRIKSWAIMAALCLPVFGAAGAFAVQLNENSAEINQDFSIPTMQVAINPGGSACTGHQTWDSTTGGCSDSAYQMTTARVVSVSPATTSLKVGETTAVTATVRTENGNLAGAGISVTWSSTNGTLSATSGVTNASGQVTVSFTASAAGIASINATAVGGSANAIIEVQSSAPTGDCLTALAYNSAVGEKRLKGTYPGSNHYNGTIVIDGVNVYSGKMSIFELKDVQRWEGDDAKVKSQLAKYRYSSQYWLYGSDGGIYYPYDVSSYQMGDDSPEQSYYGMGVCVIQFGSSKW